MLTETLLQTVTGRFREGRVELLSTPEGVEGAEVIVTFLPQDNGQPPSDAPPIDQSKMMWLGMSAGGEPATEADFRAAEYHPDDDD